MSLILDFSEKTTVEFLVARRLKQLEKNKKKNNGLSNSLVGEYMSLQGAYTKLLNDKGSQHDI